MSDVVNTATIKVVADASGVEAGLRQATNAARQTGQAISQVGNGAAASNGKVDAASRGIVASIQRTTAAMEAGGRETAAYYEALARQRGADPATLAPYIAKLREVEKAQASARGGMSDIGVSAGQTAAALRQLPPQLTDIFTQLAGGQNPLMVLIQQGGQIKDSFGGAGNAIEAIGGEIKSFFASLAGGAESASAVGDAISDITQQQDSLAGAAQSATASVGGAADAANALTEAGTNARTAFTGVQLATLGAIAGAGAAVVAIGALAYAHYKGSLEAGVYARSLILSGNAAGATVDQLSEASRQITAINGSRGAAMEAITSLVGTGQVSADKLKDFGNLAVEVQKVVGRSIQDTADDFAELGKSPLAALEKIHDKYNFVTAATYIQVKALQDQGKASEAADVAQQAYFDGIANQKDKVLASLTDWERGWIRIKGAISGAVDAVIDFAAGREDTNVQKIDTLLAAREGIEKRIANLQKRGAARDGGSYDASKDANILAAKAELEANERAINVIRDKQKAQNDAAKAKADAQKVDDAQKQWAKDADQFLDRVAQREREITVAIEQGKEAHLSSKVVEDRVAAIRKKYADTYNIGIESNIAALKRRSQLEEVIAQRELARIAAQRALGTISEEEEINKKAEAELAAVDREITLRQRELALIQKKVSATPEQKNNEVSDKEAELYRLREQRAGREEQRVNDLAILKQKDAQASEDLYTKGIVAATAERDSLIESLGAQLDYNAGIGLTKLQVAELTAARLEGIARQKEESAAALAEAEPGSKLAKIYREQAQALRDKASATITGAARDSAQELADFLDPARAETFGEALRNAFGVAGDSLTKLTGALSEYGKRQAKIDEERGAAAWRYMNGKDDEQKYLKNVADLNERNTKNQLASYGDMASAAAGFFGEHSRGYKSLMAVSQVFHAAELAMNLASIAPAMAAGAAQFFAQSGWGGFAGVAAMAAVVAGFGVAVSGGSGDMNVAADRQKANGTGTILGDSDAKSESIAKSLDAVEKNTYQGLTINSSMLTVLRSIDSGINGVSNMLYRTDGFSTTTADTVMGSAANTAKSMSSFLGSGEILDLLTGGKMSSLVGKVSNAIFGGNVSTLDTGITLDKGSLGQILAGGANVSQYTDTKKDGGLFHSDKYSTSLTDLGTEIDSQFTLIFGGMHDAILQSAAALGITGDAFNQKLDSFVLDIGKISTKDLSAEDVQKALQNAISKAGDDMAKFAVDGLGQFQNAGEGALETLTRIATEYQTVDVVFQSFGKTFGTVGLSSVAARDRLIDLAGGLDEFASQGEFFLTNFFSEQEQAAALKARIDPTLAQYGLSTEGEGASRALRDFIVGLDTTTESGAQAYTALMAIAPAFKQIVDAQQDVLDERKDLLKQLDDLTLTSKQLRDKDRAAISDSNKALYDQVQAAQAAKDAITEHATVLDLQGQMYQVLGDKVGAAAVLEQQHAAALVDMTPAVAAATKALWAAQAAESARQEELTRTNSMLSIQAQIYEITGDKAGAAAVLEQQHVNALAALDPALRDATKELWNLQAADKAAKEALQLHNSLLEIQAQIYELTGDKAAAAAVMQQQHAAALAALDPALRGATEKLWSLQEAAKATEAIKANAATLLGGVDDAFSALQKVVAREKEAVQANVDAHSAAVTKLQSLSQSLNSTFDSLKSPDQKLFERAGAQAQIRAALAIARAGGPLPEADSLKDALAAITQDASSQFDSYQDYLRDLYRTQSDIGQLGDITDKSLTVEQQALDAAQAQLTALDGVLAGAQDQIDIMKGQSISLLSIDQALQGLGTAIAAAQSNPIVGATPGISDAYQSILGRAPDSAGMQFWQNQIAAGVPLSEIIAAIRNSSESKHLQGIPGFAAGGMFGGGLRLVGENGPELEVTGPSRIWSSSQTAALLSRAGGGDSNALVAEIKALREEVKQLREANSAENRAIAKGTQQSGDVLEKWDVTGQPKERTA